MKVTKQETLYHEDHGATLKHKCGKRIVALSLFIFFFSFFGPSFFYLAFLFFLGQCSINDDHHTSIYLQLNDYNSILEQKYDSIWMPPAVYQDVQWSSIVNDIKKWTSHVNIMLAILRSCKAIWQWWSVSWMKWWKVAWQYISEWLWKCHNR